MKKFLFVLSFLFSVSNLFSQVTFEPQVRLSFLASEVELMDINASLEALAGFRIWEKWRLGLGTGLVRGHIEKYKSYEVTATAVPVLFDAKFNISNTRVSPFVHLEAGYEFLTEQDKYASDGARLTIGGGIDIRLPYGAIVAGIDYIERDWIDNLSRSINLNVGFVWRSDKKKEKLVKESTIVEY